MKTTSPWTELPPATPLPSLSGSQETEVTIIGGGITGVMAAYLLAKTGRRVSLVEKDALGSGDTSGTTAFLTYVYDLSLQKMNQSFKSDTARQVWQSGLHAITLIQDIIAKEKIDCEYVSCPAIIFATEPADRQWLQDEAALAREFGFAAEYAENTRGFPPDAYLRVDGQGKFHPMKFMRGLTQAAIAHGAVIYEKTEVMDYHVRNHLVEIKTKNGVLTAENCIITSPSPIGSQAVPIQLHTNRTYVIEAEITSGTVPEGLYWDTADPYHYFRIDRGEVSDRVILGGADHPADQKPASDPWTELESYLQKTIPQVRPLFTRRWVGPIFATTKRLPVIGEFPGQPHIRFSAGYEGNGMTFGVYSAWRHFEAIHRGAKDQPAFAPKHGWSPGAILSRLSHSNSE